MKLSEGMLRRDLAKFTRLEVNNGTIYLKNLNLISNTFQGKLLRALVEKKFYRVGALNSNPLNLRIIIPI